MPSSWPSCFPPRSCTLKRIFEPCNSSSHTFLKAFAKTDFGVGGIIKTPSLILVPRGSFLNHLDAFSSFFFLLSTSSYSRGLSTGCPPSISRCRIFWWPLSASEMTSYRNFSEYPDLLSILAKSCNGSCTKGHPTFLPPHFEASTLQRSAFEWEVAIAWMCGHTATSANGAKHTRPCRMTDRHHLHYPHRHCCLHHQFIREMP